MIIIYPHMVPFWLVVGGTALPMWSTHAQNKLPRGQASDWSNTAFTLAISNGSVGTTRVYLVDKRSSLQGQGFELRSEPPYMANPHVDAVDIETQQCGLALTFPLDIRASSKICCCFLHHLTDAIDYFLFRPTTGISLD